MSAASFVKIERESPLGERWHSDCVAKISFGYNTNPFSEEHPMTFKMRPRETRMIW